MITVTNKNRTVLNRRFYTLATVNGTSAELTLYGEIVETSLGEAIILDTGAFCIENKKALDLAVTW